MPKLHTPFDSPESLPSVEKYSEQQVEKMLITKTFLRPLVQYNKMFQFSSALSCRQLMKKSMSVLGQFKHLNQLQ